MASGVLVFGEATEDGKLNPVTAELIGGGHAPRWAGDLPPAGSGVEGLAQECVAAGADKVIVVDDPILAGLPGRRLPAGGRARRKGSRPVDRPARADDDGPRPGPAPRTAARHRRRHGLRRAFDKRRQAACRAPLLRWRARARYSINGTPQIATIRAKSQEPLEADASRSGEIVKQAAGVDAGAVRAKVTNRRKEKAEGIRLEDAKVVVGGGRGLGGPEAFQQLEELAGILGGAVGASRAVCDLGWYPVATQIGLTGKIVTPDLYIAIGISGASQHMAGISSVKNIASINKDADASIFKSSRFAVVGDWKEVVPPFIEEVKKLKAS